MQSGGSDLQQPEKGIKLEKEKSILLAKYDKFQRSFVIL